MQPGTSDALVCHVDLLASFATLTGQALPASAGPDTLDVLPRCWMGKQGATIWWNMPVATPSPCAREPGGSSRGPRAASSTTRPAILGNRPSGRKPAGPGPVDGGPPAAPPQGRPQPSGLLTAAGSVRPASLPPARRS
ncbi:MAG: hypothetical protein U1F77_11045 [Kiritimatiellia bacterium]